MSPRREVALVIDPAKLYDRRIVRGVANYVENHSLDWSLYIEEDPIARLPDLNTWTGDGILANFDNRRVAQAVSKLGVPVVGFGGGYGYYKQNMDIPYVRTDNQAIAELAARHLINLGLQHFAFCSELPNRFNGWAKEREVAFQNFVNEAGYPCEIHVARYEATTHWKQLKKDLQDWIVTLPNPIGMMASNDSYARRVLQACRARGIMVPDSIAVIGVDNNDIMCELSRPPLTSIEHGTRSLGYEAAAILDAMMAGKRPRQLTVVPPTELVERQSTDTLAIGDETIVTALTFIRKHACDPIQVKDVLQFANLSRSNLELRFREVLGRTVHAEIRRVQLETAKRLLRTSNIPIKEIVRKVGVSSVQYFTAMIRQATGQTPGQIRKDATE